MSTLQVEIPVWIRYTHNQYVVRPLFTDQLHGADEQYEKAFKKLMQAIRKQFNAFQTDGKNLNELLWYLFMPEFRFETIHLQFNYGQRFFDGKISAAWFEHGTHTYILLPAFDNYLFISAYPDPDSNKRAEEISKHIQLLARKHRKEEDTELILDSYASGKGEYCTTLDMHLFVSGKKIELAADDFWRQFLRNQTAFEGRYEITRVGYDLNDRYPNELQRAYFCDEIVSKLQQHIYSRQNEPLVLIGARKAGKTTLLSEIVCRYIEAHAHIAFYKLDSIWHLDPSRIIAGMSVIGMWQRRMEAIVDFVRNPLDKSARQDKLYFTNVVSLFRIGKSAQNNMTLSDVLKPYMQERHVQIILEATPEEWDIVSELDRGFTDVCKVVRIYEPPEETSLRIVSKIRSKLEYQHRFTIDNLALVRLVTLQKRFRRSGTFIGSMSDSLHQLAVKYAGKSIDTETIITEFSSQTHLSERLANLEVKVTRQELETHISRKLIGQPETTQRLADMLAVIKAQLNNSERPFGSFLFIGPTGVGKTEAAKILAQYLFTHEESLVRFDMNEFIDGDAVNRLVGDFTNPEGQLTTKIRYNSFCVVLLDEIEKAHPDVHNLLLQVLGEGRLTDALGRTVSFCNTVIVLTSNLGAERVGKEINLQRRTTTATSTYEKAVRDFFRPEFINRIDSIVFFQKLSAEHIGQIASLQIRGLLKRHGFLRRHTILNVSPEVLEQIARTGFDPERGGRALKRQIEKELTVQIADQLVTTRSDNPVIFNLYLHNGQLKPHLVILEHIPANQPSGIPDFTQLEMSFDIFEELLYEVEDLKEELQALDEFSDGMVYSTEKRTETSYMLSIKEMLTELEDELRNLLWEHQTGKKVNIAQTVLPIKQVSNVKMIRNDWVAKDKSFLQELSQQLQIDDYFREVHESAAKVMNEHTALYAHLAMSVAWWKYRLTHYLESGTDYGLLYIGSCVENAGVAEVAYLESMYQQKFAIDHTYVRQTDMISGKPTQLFVSFQGWGSYNLLQQEVGYHLFFTPHESPLPVEIRLFRLAAPQDAAQFVKDYQPISPIEMPENEAEKTTQYIIRVYNIAKGSPHMVTDLRTGLIHNKPLTREELNLVFYANFPEELKIEGL